MTNFRDRHQKLNKSKFKKKKKIDKNKKLEEFTLINCKEMLDLQINV